MKAPGSHRSDVSGDTSQGQARLQEERKDNLSTKSRNKSRTVSPLYQMVALSHQNISRVFSLTFQTLVKLIERYLWKIYADLKKDSSCVVSSFSSVLTCLLYVLHVS